MARWRNLRDPVIPDTNRRVRDLEAASPIGFSSVDRGGLRIASDQGILVEGQGLVTGLWDVTGTLSGSGNLKWTGPTNLTGKVDVSGNADFTGTVDAFYFRVNNDGTITVVSNEGVAVTRAGSGQARVNPNDIYIGAAGNYARLTPGGAQVVGIDEASSPTSHDILLIDSNGKFLRGPKYASPGSGGDPGGGGDNPKGLIYPYPLAQAGDRYGPRDYAPSPYHYGIDWPKPAWTGIPAAGDGTVILSEDTGYLWGQYIRIDHGDGVWTAYAHMVDGGRYVSVGDTVTRGQIIGGVGTTGPSTGNHLHFEVWISGSRVDPEWYIGPE